MATHHGDPAEARHALADGRQVVEERRGAVFLAKVLHLVDQVGQRLQEVLQIGLEKKKRLFTGSPWKENWHKKTNHNQQHCFSNSVKIDIIFELKCSNYDVKGKPLRNASSGCSLQARAFKRGLNLHQRASGRRTP